MSRILRVLTLLLLLTLLSFMIFVNRRGLIHLFGIDTQQSDNYDFFSGVGPVIVTAIGYTGMIVGLWHHVNCHESGCLRIGRHKINGTPWCNRHHTSARSMSVTELSDVVAKLDELVVAVRELSK